MSEPQEVKLEFYSSDQHFEPLFLAVGRASMYWTALERELGAWLGLATGMTKQMAHDLFFSASSFRARMDMLRASVAHTKLGEPAREFLDQVIKKALTYSKFRNTFAHGSALMVDPSSDEKLPMVIEVFGGVTHEKLRAGLTAEKLDRAAHNFYAFTLLLFEAQRALQKKQPELLPELAARVQLLPNEPGSSERSQRQAGRERQRQAAALKTLQSKSTKQDG